MSKTGKKRILGFYEAWSGVALWQNKERQLGEVRSMFAKREITNLTRIRLNQRIVNNRVESSAKDS